MPLRLCGSSAFSSASDGWEKACAALMRTYHHGMLESIDHVNLVVRDLEGMAAFYSELLGLPPTKRATISGPWIAAVVGLTDVEADVIYLDLPEGPRVELLRYNRPPAERPDGLGRSNTPGLRHLAFRVRDIDAIVKPASPARRPVLQWRPAQLPDSQVTYAGGVRKAPGLLPRPGGKPAGVVRISVTGPFRQRALSVRGRGGRAPRPGNAAFRPLGFGRTQTSVLPMGRDCRPSLAALWAKPVRYAPTPRTASTRGAYRRTFRSSRAAPWTSSSFISSSAAAVARSTKLVMPQPWASSSFSPNGDSRLGVKPAACRVGQKRLPGRPK